MLKIRNYTENMVDITIEEIINKYDMCNCEKCRLDVKALALNSLPPRYFVSEEGELYKKIEVLEKQMQIDVVLAVTNAILKIKDNPKH